MTFALVSDPDSFAERVGPLLAARPELNVVATVLDGVREGRFDDVAVTLACRIGPEGHADALAMRTEPYRMLCAGVDAEGADQLLDAWLPVDPQLPGVSGSPESARAVAAAWAARTGGTVALDRGMALHATAAAVDPPIVPTGTLRQGRPSERELLLEWWEAFAVEAHSVTTPAQSARNVDARLREGGAYVWDDDGPVSLVAINPPVSGVPRIGPVYTPPHKRRRGYAGMAVAEVTRAALRAGAPRVMLFTDLANPTSNKIYAEVGYRPIGAWEEIAFKAPTGSSAPGSLPIRP